MACGTCLWWDRVIDEEAGFRMCSWPDPVLPFWACIDAGRDHDNWTTETDGKGCPTYEAISAQSA